MFKKFVLLFLVTFLAGCASTIQIDGKNIPSHAYVQKNPRTNIKVHFAFIKYVEKSEGKEKFNLPYFLQMNEDIIIPNDTKSLFLSVEVVNLMKTEYKIKQYYRLWDNKLYPYNVLNKISESKYTNRTHHIRLPFKKGIKVEYDLYIFDKNNDLIMKIGQIRYKIK